MNETQQSIGSCAIHVTNQGYRQAHIGCLEQAILEATNLGPLYLERGFENYIELASDACRKVYLMANPEDGEDWSLSLKLWPADTKNQARDFFQIFDALFLLPNAPEASSYG